MYLKNFGLLWTELIFLKKDLRSKRKLRKQTILFLPHVRIYQLNGENIWSQPICAVFTSLVGMLFKKRVIKWQPEFEGILP